MGMQRRRIGIILQARMGSTRLTGKVLKLLAGKPMIQWIIERLQACKNADVFVLATSVLEENQPLVDLARKLGVSTFRGSESDVLDRYYKCALAYHLDHVVRATGDNPFVDPEECDRLIEFYFGRQLDYAVASTSPMYGYPIGMGVEVFSFEALERSWQEGHAPHHREHVNEYILENPFKFKQDEMLAPWKKCEPGLSLTVDTPEQFEFAEEVYSDYLSQNLSPHVQATWAIDMFKKKV